MRNILFYLILLIPLSMARAGDISKETIKPDMSLPKGLVPCLNAEIFESQGGC